MHQSNVFFTKTSICQNYFLFIKKLENGISTFHSNGTGAPKQAQCITRERAATSRSLRFWVSTIRIWEDNMLWCWNLYIWSFLDYFVFSSWLPISYFIVSVDSWNLEICQAWCPKWKKPTETSAVEVFVTVRYDLENCTIDDICWNFIASTTKMKKSNNLLMRYILLIYRSMFEHLFIYFICVSFKTHKEMFRSKDDGSNGSRFLKQWMHCRCLSSRECSDARRKRREVPS